MTTSPPPVPAGHGVAVWSSPAWRAAALAWLDERLADAGLRRTGEATHPHVRPWATVVRAPTTGGTVWLKAAGPGTAFEAGLYDVLARVVPDRVLVPLAADPERGWIVLPDGGPTLRDRQPGPEQVEGLAAALADYARLQRDLAPHVDDLLAAGVADMRPAVMPGRLDEALAATAGHLDRDRHARVAALRPAFADWCDQLAASALPASLDHNDLHGGNILGDGSGARFYDWGDSVVAHPVTVLLVPLRVAADLLGTGPDDRRVAAVRDVYLAVLAGDAPGEDLVATFDLAARVATVARTLVWDRALRAAHEQGEDAHEWADAPAETLAMLLGHA
jgi:Phosphotransferase enzyme family